MRHEEKYICSERQLILLTSRLDTVMMPDINQKGDSYRIRSLYFDTADDRFYAETCNGVYRRRKYRIRFYDMNCDFFRMERKDTEGRLKQKFSTRVDRDYVEKTIRGELMPCEGEDDLLTEVHSMRQTEGLRPVAIIQYRRKAYTYPLGGVRITIDRDISCSFRTEEFLDPDALMFPIMPYGKHILEVKYDTVLPGFISAVLDMGSLERVAFSKYAYSRDVINGNGRRTEGYEF